MTVDLITNRDIFEDVYPSDCEESDESENDASGSEKESEAVKALDEELRSIIAEHRKACEEKNSASGRLTILENYGLSVTTSRPDNLENCVSAYSTERKKAAGDYTSSEIMIEKLDKKLAQVIKQSNKIRKAAAKDKVKAMKARLKQKEKRERAAKEKKEAKKRLQMERIQFWPKKVYRVVLSLDTNSDLTPASSRRGSTDSLVKPAVSPLKASSGSGPETASDSCRISLSMSYITYSASWSPRYDLNLTTTTSSGLIIYRAEFYNATSETWRDAKVILSTSQTSFQGLGEPIPSMQPWHIRLEKNASKTENAGKGDLSQALYSRNEQEYKHKAQDEFASNPSQHRNELFGLNSHDRVKIHSNPNQDFPLQLQFLENQNLKRLALARNEQMQAPHQVPQMMPPAQMSQIKAPHQQQQQHQHSLQYQTQTQMQSAPASKKKTVASNSFTQAPQTCSFPPAGDFNRYRSSNAEIEAEIDDLDEEVATLAVPDPILSFQESSWEEAGLTATYDVPGTRTIPPSPTTRRHRIASIAVKDIQLSYVLVPKLRAAAFLKARLRNTSAITLLKGATGLTLDGTFLGNTSLPRCSAGESFNLSLGVDPAVNVVYAKPIVRRSESGLFQKEGSCVYTRTITVTNTKANAAVEGLVLDQVPVSEDERLKVDILHPKGLVAEGNSAKTGAAVVRGEDLAKSARVDGKGGEWGKATATLRKGGEVAWEVKLNPGMGVRLALEYEARFPGHEVVVGGR